MAVEELEGLEGISCGFFVFDVSREVVRQHVCHGVDIVRKDLRGLIVAEGVQLLHDTVANVGLKKEELRFDCLRIRSEISNSSSRRYDRLILRILLGEIKIVHLPILSKAQHISQILHFSIIFWQKLNITNCTIFSHLAKQYPLAGCLRLHLKSTLAQDLLKFIMKQPLNIILVDYKAAH